MAPDEDVSVNTLPGIAPKSPGPAAGVQGTTNVGDGPLGRAGYNHNALPSCGGGGIIQLYY